MRRISSKEDLLTSEGRVIVRCLRRLERRLLKVNKRLDVAKALDAKTAAASDVGDADKETQYAVLAAEQQVVKTKTLIKLQNDICQLEKRLLDLNIENVGELGASVSWRLLARARNRSQPMVALRFKTLESSDGQQCAQRAW
jgi:hypothetical protein